MVPPPTSIPILLHPPRRGGRPAGGKMLWAIAWLLAGGWASLPAICLRQAYANATPPLVPASGGIAHSGLFPSPLGRALPAPLRSSQLGLGNLRLGLPAAAVRARLGTPRRIQASPPGNYNRYEIWHYDTLTVGMGDGRVVDLRTTSLRWVTPDGVRVRDGSHRVAMIYGEPDWREGDRWGYNTADGGYLTFRLAGDRVMEILCGWLPD